MFFLFLILSAVGGYIAGTGIYNRDTGFIFLGLVISIISIIACGYYGYPA